MKARNILLNRNSLAVELTTDVLIVGAGGAGMYAAIAAAREGADVLLIDKNMIGRGGATVMAQMTVAAALAEHEPDCWEDHLADTLAAGRGLCDEVLASTLCRLAPERMRELDGWGVGWARNGERISQVHAPGHGVHRCCYVDFLNTGPAVAGTLRKVVGKTGSIRRLSDVQIVELVARDGVVHGARAIHVLDGSDVDIVARATVIATGGLTRLYSRSSASLNMGGDGYALALEAGARLTDMEFVQFFPIGHLAPRLVGMDPIMWDPFRYKLGGRLLNGHMEEFVDRYGGHDSGNYTATRDLATYAICQEVDAGRGSPNGGAYLSFAHLSEAQLRAAFGPVIDRLRNNGIDLTSAPVEVSPIAHYHMGGIVVDERMATCVEGLFAAGEAVGGAGGANRLSGNAITEAVVFGEIAGRQAAVHCRTVAHHSFVGRPGRDVARGNSSQFNATFAQAGLRELMWEHVGPFRTADGLKTAIAWIQKTYEELMSSRPPPATAFATELVAWHELKAGLLVAQSIAASALRREESRGAHQRDDFPTTEDTFAHSQIVSFEGGRLRVNGEALEARTS
jgi:succinate dehydrogenase / fumarate reductase, flavoprotein subunit